MNSVNIDDDVVIKKHGKFIMSHSCESVAIVFDNVIATAIDSWEDSQIKVAVRISDTTMNELCKAWLKHKGKKV